MTVTYTKSQREFAKTNGLKLTTLSIPGWTFQGPSSQKEVEVIEKCMLEVLKVRSARIAAEASPAASQ